MPKISAMNTPWKSWEIDVRTPGGCTFYEEGVCRHPNKSLAKAIPCALDVEIGSDCPLESTPVIIRRTPDHIYEAVQKAIHNQS
jgi:hypothetical protein